MRWVEPAGSGRRIAWRALQTSRCRVMPPFAQVRSQNVQAPGVPGRRFVGGFAVPVVKFITGTFHFSGKRPLPG